MYLTGLLRTDKGLLTLFSAHVEPSQSRTEPSSEEVEEVTPQGVTGASLSPTIQVPSQPAGGGSGPPREPDWAAVKGECRVH